MPTSSSSSLPSWSNPRDMKEMGEEVHDVAALQEQENSDDFLSRPFSTLDEPIKDTIMRDVTSVWSKLKVVVMPLKRTVS